MSKPQPDKVVLRFLVRLADLNPPLGYPGGPCQVIDRVVEKNIGTRGEKMISKIEDRQKLDRGEEKTLYPPMVERGPSGTSFRFVALNPHAQYRMDMRGVTVTDVHSAMKAFQKEYAKEKSRKSPKGRRWEQSFQRSESIRYTAPGSLTVVFQPVSMRGNIGAQVETVMWEGGTDPAMVNRDQCESFEGWSKRTPKPTALEHLFEGRTADLRNPRQCEIVIDLSDDSVSLSVPASRRLAQRYAQIKMQPEPGYKTFVRDDSAKGLPTDQDRTKQVNLPPGSATPGGAGRNIPKFEMNTPNNGIDERPRTPGVPGAEWGNPTKFDYGTPTRRYMEGSTPSGTPGEWVRDQGSPANNEIKQPGADLEYEAEGPTTYKKKPDEKEGVPAGSTMPTGYVDQMSPATSRVVPDQMKETLRENLTYQASQKTAARISDILGGTAPELLKKARPVKFKRNRFTEKNKMWTYTASGSKGESYKMRLKAVGKKGTKDLSKMDVYVSCTCPFWRYQGPEHWAKVGGYLYGRPQGTATRPSQKDPQGKNRVCKHVAALLESKKGRRLASSEEGYSISGPVPDPKMVAARWIDENSED